MLELIALGHVNKEVDPNVVKPAKKAPNMVLILGYIFWFVLLVAAYWRAYSCSNFSGEPPALHFLFATVSPVLYLIFSLLGLLGPCS